MRRIAVFMVTCAIVASGLTLRAGEKPPDALVDLMKSINESGQAIKRAVDGKELAAAAKAAADIQKLFAQNEEFWTKRKVADAVDAAKGASKAAKELETAAKAGNGDAAAAAQKAMAGSCKSCHDAHREKLADGTSEIK